MNNIFSISRFTLLLKKDIAENIRLYAIGAASLLFGLATLMVLFTPMMSLPEEGGQFFATFPIYNIFVFGVCIAASLMFAPMRTKQGRISLFTLPATSTEKYLEQVFVHIICFTMMFVCCVILAEGIRMVVAPLLWGPGATGGAYAVDRYINHFSFSPGGVSAMVFANLEAVGITFNLLMAVFAAGAFCSVGIFSLGAALWPKYSFIKTYVAAYAVEIVLGIGALIVSGITEAMDFDPFGVIDTRGFLISLAVALSVIAVVTFVASYITFVKKQVIH